MMTTLVFVLYVFIGPVWLQQIDILNSDVQNGEGSFLSQHHVFPTTDQCIGNCSSQLNSPNIVNNLGNQPVHHVMASIPSGVFGFIYSAASSLLDYVYRVFAQPWIGMLGYGRSASIDRNFYTVEDRSGVDPPLTTVPSVNWHELGTTVFQVLSSLLGKTQVPPSELPPPFSPNEAPTDSTRPISAINPL